jgi:Cytochrome P460
MNSSRTVVLVAGAVLSGLILSGAAVAESFSPYVDDKGKISIPKDFRSWYFLGSWGVAADEEGKAGSKGFHNVYTQPETVSAFRKTGKFPDGAVLVKELLKAKTDGMTTGEISYATETEGWFIMIKDSKGRFKGNKLWGRGWGWSLFKAKDPMKTVTKNFKANCIPCHVPAKKNDWIYVRGYPALKN